MKKAISTAVAFALFTSSCAIVPVADSYQPIVDMRNVDRNRYAQDLTECRQYAARVDQQQAAIAGAVAGALFATVLGAALGLRGNDLAQVAAGGAVTGGVQTGANAGLTQAQIIVNCLIGRGYAVIG